MAEHLKQAQRWLERLRAAAANLDRPVTFMEVCGTHTMSAFRCGLHSLIPQNVTLLSGPGCPVCVTAQSDIDQMIALAKERDAIICTYGDMLRVPGKDGSLEKARSLGADVRVIYSTLDAVKLAVKTPDRQVVLAAVGFETTAPATAAAVKQAQTQGITNFSALTSHKLVIPAMLGLLAGGDVGIDGFLCPGHVSVIIGSEAYQPILDQYNLPCVISGFEDWQMTRGLARLTEQIGKRSAVLVNDYPQVVTPAGNTHAWSLLTEVFEPATVRWRGIGEIPDSGLVLRGAYADYCAMRKFDLTPMPDRELGGCLCGKVITGNVTPADCPLFGTTCTPINPIGPCMVSAEGTCQAWFKYKRPPEVSPEVPSEAPQKVPLSDSPKAFFDISSQVAKDTYGQTEVSV